MPKHALVVDPGKLTGWILYNVSESQVHSSGEHEMMPFLNHAYGVISVMNVDVVCESFHITKRTATLSQQPWSLEIIGALRWMASRHDRFFHLQQPSQAKKFADNERLRDAGLWTSGSKGHVNDAARHLVLWLAKNGLKTPTGLL